MSQTVTGLVKKNRVKMGEPRRIGVAPSAPAGTAPGAAVQPEVRIAEEHADHAVLEVRCGCGQITCIECRWKGPAPQLEPGARTPGEPEPSPENEKEEK